jgi:hypothetical protein
VEILVAFVAIRWNMDRGEASPVLSDCLRAFVPVTTDFIKCPTGQVVGE